MWVSQRFRTLNSLCPHCHQVSGHSISITTEITRLRWCQPGRELRQLVVWHTALRMTLACLNTQLFWNCSFSNRDLTFLFYLCSVYGFEQRGNPVQTLFWSMALLFEAARSSFTERQTRGQSLLAGCMFCCSPLSQANVVKMQVNA